MASRLNQTAADGNVAARSPASALERNVPFARDELVGNIPTEEVLRALGQRGVNLPLQASLANVIALNDAITNEFAR